MRGGLNLWRKWFRSYHRAEETQEGKLDWWPSYRRLRDALHMILPMDCRDATLLDRYVCIAGKGAGMAREYRIGTQFLAVSTVKCIKPNPRGGYRIYLDGWSGQTRACFFAADALVAAMLRQLRFLPKVADAKVLQRELILPREGEFWWTATVVGVEGYDERSAYYQARRCGCLRASLLAIPFESDEELLFQKELVRLGRSFQVPLLAGTVPKLPTRRPDVLLEDTGAWPPPCVEVVGMLGRPSYDENHQQRMLEYANAGINVGTWRKGEPFCFLDEGPFRCVSHSAMLPRAPELAGA